MARPTLIDLRPDDCNQGLRYYPIMVYLDKCNGSFNSLDNLSNRIYVPSKIKDVHLIFLI